MRRYFVFIFFIMCNNVFSQQTVRYNTIKKAGDYSVGVVKGDGILSFYITSALLDSINTLKGSVYFKFDQQKEAKETFDLSNTAFFSVPMKKAYFKSGILFITINKKEYKVNFKRSDIIKTENGKQEKIPSSVVPTSHQGHTH